MRLKLLLERMGEIDYHIKDNILFLKKNNITFGKVKDDKIYLKDKTGVFTQIDPSILQTEDEFIKASTRAYWSVTGKLTE